MPSQPQRSYVTAKQKWTDNEHKSDSLFKTHNSLRLEIESRTNIAKSKRSTITTYQYVYFFYLQTTKKHKSRSVRSIQKCVSIIIIIAIIYPLTAKVVGAQQMISQPVSSIFPCSPLPSGACRIPGLSISWCCLPASSSVCLVFFPPPLKDGFGQTWWTGDMTIPLQFASLYDDQEVFVSSDCLLDPGKTSSLYEMRSILR